MKYRLANNGFQEIGTENLKMTIIVPNESFSPDWMNKQEASYAEYEETHDGSVYSEDVLNFMAVLKDTISEKVLDLLETREKVNIIDIGCGTSRSIPIYIPNSKHINYIGLDPIPKNITRNYPFICSRLEDISKVLEERSVDLFLFCTSLDHFENIDGIYNIIKPLSSKNAYVIFLSGMHDPQLIATDHGKVYLYNLHKSKFRKGIINKIKYLNRLRIFVQLMFKNYNTLTERQEKLEKNIPLDPYHFYYFQQDEYRKFMQTKMGEPVSEKLLTGGIMINVNRL